MTSLERKEKRYKRRQAARLAKKAELCKPYDDFASVFTYDHLYDCYRKCRSGVSWKASVQRYIATAPLQVYQTQKELTNATFRSKGFREFDILERGKKRHIRSVDIKERVAQRCLCDYSLVPMLSRSFVYDNGASLQGKGYHFSSDRLYAHLQKHYRKYGAEGYVLLFDFSKFFDNIPHSIIRERLAKCYTDEKILHYANYFMDMFPGEVGLGLGSQVSQIYALTSADKLDHYIKDVLRMRFYGRYMDDGYIIHRDKAVLWDVLSKIEVICKELGIVLNRKKVQIVKLTHGFVYLKKRYILLPGGKVVRKILRSSVVRMRRKLKSFRDMLAAGVLTRRDIWQSYQSWRSYAMHFDGWRTVVYMDRVYKKAIGKEEILCKK